jgi:phage baseplate assembly protein W
MTIPSTGLPTGDIPHFRIPFSIGVDGTVETVQQGTSDEIIQNVAMIVGTRPGTRFMLPQFGIIDPTFRGIDQIGLKNAVAKYEPRATVNVIVTPDNEEVVTVQVAGGTP